MTANVPTSPQELATLIREGCKLRPRQALRSYYERGAACAMGAAYLAAGGRPRGDMAEAWVLRMSSLPIAACPQCRQRMAIGGLVEHLNDVHEWSREHIADWLEALP